jgi:hypothetical protein
MIVAVLSEHSNGLDIARESTIECPVLKAAEECVGMAQQM